MNKNLLLLLLPISCLFWGGCSDEDSERDITLSQSSVFLKNGGSPIDSDSLLVSILTGNGDYKITLTSGTGDLVDVEIVDNSIKFKANKIQGRATFLLQDKLGKEKEITVYVDEKYFLLEVNYLTVEVKAVNTITENLLKEEILTDKSFDSGNILELVSPSTKDGFRVYDNMSDVVAGKIKKQGVFELDSQSSRLSLTIGDKSDNFVLLGNITYIIYLYFGIEKNFDDTNALRSSPPSVERLGYDLTNKYQEKYPEAKIEYARMIISTKPYLYKFVPVNP